jgi:hypothetical protein
VASIAPVAVSLLARATHRHGATVARALWPGSGIGPGLSSLAACATHNSPLAGGWANLSNPPGAQSWAQAQASLWHLRDSESEGPDFRVGKSEQSAGSTVMGVTCDSDGPDFMLFS